MRPLVLGGCFDQAASEGWELCLQATLMGTGLVARKFSVFQCLYVFPGFLFPPKNDTLIGILSPLLGAPRGLHVIHACMCMCMHFYLFLYVPRLGMHLRMCMHLYLFLYVPRPSMQLLGSLVFCVFLLRLFLSLKKYALTFW